MGINQTGLKNPESLKKARLGYSSPLLARALTAAFYPKVWICLCPFLRVSNKFSRFGIGLISRPGSGPKRGKNSRLKVCVGCGMAKITLRITRLSNNLGRDDRID